MAILKTVNIACTLYYASVHTPNPLGEEGKKKYEVNAQVDDATSEALKEIGFMPAKRESGELVRFGELEMDIFRPKRKEAKGPPEVKDIDGNPVTSLIGNGSKAMISVTIYSGTLKTGRKFITGHLNSVTVLDLVEFTPTAEVLGSTPDLVAGSDGDIM